MVSIVFMVDEYCSVVSIVFMVELWLVVYLCSCG